MRTHSLKEAVLSLAGFTAALTCRQDHVNRLCALLLLNTTCQSQRGLSVQLWEDCTAALSHSEFGYTMCMSEQGSILLRIPQVNHTFPSLHTH